MRNNYHVPIIVTYLGIEVASTVFFAVCIFKGEYLGIGIKCLCTGNKLANGCVLHNYHWLACRAKAAHFHGCADEGVGLACSNLMGKQQRLCRGTDNSLCLMGIQLESMTFDNSCGTTKMSWHKFVGYFLGYAVVEQFIIDSFYALRQFCITLHLAMRPVLKVLAYLVYLVGTGHRRFFVNNGLCSSITAVACRYTLGNTDALAGNGGFDKFMS